MSTGHVKILCRGVTYISSSRGSIGGVAIHLDCFATLAMTEVRALALDPTVKPQDDTIKGNCHPAQAQRVAGSGAKNKKDQMPQQVRHDRTTPANHASPPERNRRA